MSDPSISFGHGKKVEFTNKNAISGNAFNAPDDVKDEDITIWNNKKALFQHFDSNDDNILDDQEIEVLQSYLNKAGGKRISKKEMEFIKNNLSLQAERAGKPELAEQFKNLTREDLYNFTKQIAENTDDSIQAEWVDNTLTVTENGTTTISEYSDNTHQKLVKQIVEENGTKIIKTFDEEGNISLKIRQKGTVTEFLDVTSDLVTYRETNLGNDNIKKEKFEYTEGSTLPSKVEITDSDGNKTVREYAEDRSYTETTNDGTVTRFDKDGNKIEDPTKKEPVTVTPESVKYKVKKDEHWYKIVQDQYGVKDHKTTLEIVHQLKDLHGKDKYGSGVQYNVASMPKELTLPAELELHNGTKIQLKDLLKVEASPEPKPEPKNEVKQETEQPVVTTSEEVVSEERTEQQTEEHTEQQSSTVKTEDVAVKISDGTSYRIDPKAHTITKYDSNNNVLEQRNMTEAEKALSTNDLITQLQNSAAPREEQSVLNESPVSDDASSKVDNKDAEFTYTQVKEQIYGHIDGIVSGVRNRNINMQKYSNGEVIYKVTSDGFSAQGKSIEEINKLYDNFIASLRTTECGAKFKVVNGNLICANLETLKGSNKDNLDDILFNQMFGSGFSEPAKLQHCAYLQLLKVPEAERTDAEKSFMQKHLANLNQKGFTILSDGHIADTKIHSIDETSQIQISVKDGKNYFTFTSLSADGKLNTKTLEESEFDKQFSKELLEHLKKLIRVTDEAEPLQATA